MARPIQINDYILISDDEYTYAYIIEKIDETNGDIYFHSYDDPSTTNKLILTETGYQIFDSDVQYQIQFMTREEGESQLGLNPLKEFLLDASSYLVIEIFRNLDIATLNQISRQSGRLGDLAKEVRLEKRGKFKHKKIVVTADGRSFLALRTNGTVVGWGDNFYGTLNIPEIVQGQTIALAAGQDHGLALLKDKTVVAWGSIDPGDPDLGAPETDVPPEIQGKTIAISAGSHTSAALLENGRVVRWGIEQIPKQFQGNIIDILEVHNLFYILLNDKSIYRFDYSNEPFLINDFILTVSAGITFDRLIFFTLTENKTIIVSGTNLEIVPLELQGKIIDVSVGHELIVYLLEDKSIVIQSERYDVLPEERVQGHVIEVVAGAQSIAVLLDDDSIISWGEYPYPPGLNIF